MTNFMTVLESKRIRGSNDRRRVIQSQWKAAQALMSVAGFDESNATLWSDQCERLFDAALDQEVSFGYFVKLLGLINLYGHFLERTKYTPVGIPRGFNKQRFLDQGLSNASSPLTETALLRAKDHFTESEYRFLRASLYLGLRPTEVQSFADWIVEIKDGTEILVVYQSKLQQLDKASRFKVIPLLEIEQQTIVHEIVNQRLQPNKPTLKKMHRVFGPTIHRYGGRKGLVRFLMDRGYTEYECSTILGHQSVATTRSYYTDHSHAKRVTALGIAKRHQERVVG
jgi:hypothetical protein